MMNPGIHQLRTSRILAENCDFGHLHHEKPLPMGHFIARLPLGLITAAGISLAAYRLGTLTRSGVIAATVAGGLVFAGTGLRGSAGMLAYFSSSSALGKLSSSTQSEQRRGNTRDGTQVLANGGVPALLAILSAVGPERSRSLARVGFAGSLAAATADTWATEIGSRARSTPRSIVTLRHVPRSSSGGVTVLGLLASAAGAAFIAGVAGSDLIPRQPRHKPLFAIAFGGFSGSLADSLLGATVQELRVCDVCLLQTERATCCGQTTRRIRGVAGIDNDVVNVVAVAIGAAVTIVTFMPCVANSGPAGAAASDVVARLRRFGAPI
jgi:uncharacterized protein (TIGR00297 family)